MVTRAGPDGTAGAGSDYSTTSETLRFDPLETTKTIQVPVLTDSLSEPSEDFEGGTAEPVESDARRRTGRRDDRGGPDAGIDH